MPSRLRRWKIHLSALSDGEPHPAARTTVLSYTFAPERAYHDILDMSITDSRVAVLRTSTYLRKAQIVVWDWTMGQILLVRRLIVSNFTTMRTSHPIKELENEFCRSAKLVDDRWLAFILVPREAAAPPQLVLTVVGPKLTRTLFHFDPWEHMGLKEVCLHMEMGGHEPSPEESLLAPFFPDTSQRILAVEIRKRRTFFVMKTEVLLGLAQEWGGVALEWEQWKAHSIEVQQPRDLAVVSCVSGPRLFFTPTAQTWVDVYDFSPQASARHLETTTNRRGMVQRCMRPSIRKRHLPWPARRPATVHFINGGHDSIVFLMVNVPYFQNLTRI